MEFQTIERLIGVEQLLMGGLSFRPLALDPAKGLGGHSFRRPGFPTYGDPQQFFAFVIVYSTPPQ